MSHLRLHWPYRLAVVGAVIAQVAMMGQRLGPRVMVPWLLVTLVATYVLARKLHRPLLTLSVLLPALPALVALLPEKSSASLESGLRAVSPTVTRSSAAPSLRSSIQLPIESPAASRAKAVAGPHAAKAISEEARILAELRAEIAQATNSEMVRFLRALCSAYASNDRPQIARLEPLATIIGEELNRRGGIQEMRRVWTLASALADGSVRQGARTLDMHWNGIGEWRG